MAVTFHLLGATWKWMRCLICIATLHENDKTAFFGDLFIMLVRYQSIWKKYLFIIYYMYVHVSFSCQHSPTVSLEANDLLFCPFKALLLVNLIKERYMYELSLDQAVFSNVQSDQLLWVTTSHFNIPKFRGNVFGAILGQMHWLYYILLLVKVNFTADLDREGKGSTPRKIGWGVCLMS